MPHKFELPDLPYAYDALEPVISKEIMTLHHDKHHAAYVNNLNAALEKYEKAENENDLNTCVSLQPAIKFNGGGHINHTLFWTMLISPKEGGDKSLSGPLADAIQRDFGSFEDFKKEFQAKTGSIQGSGWGWLASDKKGHLKIATCANQDPLHGTTGLIPLLGVDVWEHAFYLDYKNAKPEYLEAIWQVVNWPAVAERYEKARG